MGKVNTHCRGRNYALSVPNVSLVNNEYMLNAKRKCFKQVFAPRPPRKPKMKVTLQRLIGICL